MKNIAIYLSFALLFSGCLFRKCNPASNTAFGQPVKTIPLSSFKNDTLAYLKENFLVSKNKFIGKSINLLIGEIEIPLQSYTLDIGNPFIEEKIFGIDLNLEPTISKRLKLHNNASPSILYISLQQPIDYKKAIALSKKNRSNWTKEVADFFGDKIVADISMINHGNPLPPKPKK